jgi:hypothetical protein
MQKHKLLNNRWLSYQTLIIGFEKNLNVFFSPFFPFFVLIFKTLISYLDTNKSSRYLDF